MTQRQIGTSAALVWFFVGLSAVCPTANAQHSDIGVYRTSEQRIVTVDSSGDEQKVFLRSFDFFGHPFGNTSFPAVYSGDDPGFVASSAPAGLQQLPGRMEVSIGFLPFDFGAGAGNLFHWDGTGAPAFGTVPLGHSLFVTDGRNRETSFDGSALAVDGGLVSVTDSQGGIHDHIQFRLDDNDNQTSTEPSRGIYLMSAQLNADGLMSSTPFAIALSSPDVSRDAENEAINWLETNLDSFRFGPVGDLNNNGQLDLADIDILVQGIATESTDVSLDLSNDGQVTLDDLDAWRDLASESILGGNGTISVGDGNLDGSVDAADLELWSSNQFTTTPAWSAGDFNADGFVDGSDFNLWNTNRSLAASVTASVPEPKGILLSPFVLLIMSMLRREQPS